MSTIHTVPLPTFEALGVSEVAVSVVDAGAIAREWFDAFSNATATGSPTNVAALFTTFSPMWRDLLCLSWDFHTKTGVDSIHTFLSDHLASSGFSQLALQDNSISFQRLAPNLAWITGILTHHPLHRPYSIYDSAQGPSHLKPQLVRAWESFDSSLPPVITGKRTPFLHPSNLSRAFPRVRVRSGRRELRDMVHQVAPRKKRIFPAVIKLRR